MDDFINDPSLSPLMALLAQAERERDEVLAQLHAAVQADAAAQVQACQLREYRTDYEARYRERFRTQASGIDVLQSYQAFMARLTLAIEQQQQVVAQAGERVEAARQALRQQELRVASVRKLLERRLAELRLASDRRDQKQTDEFASRAAWGRLAEQRASPPAL